MLFAEFFKSDVPKLPKRYNGFFPAELKQAFEKYIQGIKSIKPGSLYGWSNTDQYFSDLKNSIPNIEKFCAEIYRAVQAYYKGNAKTCYNILNRSITTRSKEFGKLITDPKNFSTLNEVHNNGFFRIREHNPIVRVSAPKDLFHMPFELRHKVANFRYSISGLPCLYLASSLYVAWKETGSLPNFYFSHYTPSANFNMKVLNFSYLPQQIGEWEFQFWNDLTLPMVKMWPLIAACSFVVQYPGENFKPEYIIPQCLFQMKIKGLEFDAIRYPSTQIAFVKWTDGRPLHLNLAIKTKKIRKKDFCKWLADQFEVSTPILVNAQNNNLRIANSSSIHIIKEGNQNYDYENSAFDISEKSAITQAHRKI